ncbi:MAG: recombination mediator RecR [Candidatus Gastranaerophilaceae bacterium]
MEYTRPLAELTEFFQRFPGIGPKSAQRLAFYLLKMPLSDVEKFAAKMVEAKSTIKCCSKCFNMSASDPCEICSDDNRNHQTICVVAETKDLIAIEKTREFKGVYHVLQGVISPIEGIGATDIRVKELVTRIAEDNIQEVILALNPSVEGEATTLYLAKLLKPFNIKVSRIALGIPVGSDLEYADEITLARAIEGRREL